MSVLLKSSKERKYTIVENKKNCASRGCNKVKYSFFADKSIEIEKVIFGENIPSKVQKYNTLEHIKTKIGMVNEQIWKK